MKNQKSEKQTNVIQAQCTAITITLALIVTACVTIQVDQGDVAESATEPQYIQVGQSEPITPTDVPAAAATPTVYVPEGQLFYSNFSGMTVGTTIERHPGIVLYKPEVGLQVEISINTEYLLAAGLADHPDGNISTFAHSLSDPARTSVLMACRIKTERDAEGVNNTSQGYMVELRFDGKARLMKRINEQDITLADWKSNISLNPTGSFTNLYLLCDGARILFIANGETVFDLMDAELTAGDFALGVRNWQDDFTSVVVFDKYAVFEP